MVCYFNFVVVIFDVILWDMLIKVVLVFLCDWLDEECDWVKVFFFGE